MTEDRRAVRHEARPSQVSLEEDALVAAARMVLWALREPIEQRRLPVFSIAALLLLEEALEPYAHDPAQVNGS